MDFLDYILKSSVCLSVFYLVYLGFGNRKNHPAVSRIMINLALLLSLIIPLIQISFSSVPQVFLLPSLEQIDFQEIITNSTAYGATDLAEPGHGVSSYQILSLMYFTGATLLVFNFIAGFFKLYRLIRRGRIKSVDGAKVYILNCDITPLSIWKFIFISEKDYRNNFHSIFIHEYAHFKQFHSLDIIIWQLLQILFWPNPFYYLFLRELQSQHEYQADQFAIKAGIDVSEYQLLLIRKSVGEKKFSLASKFTNSKIKNRIIKMNELKEKKMSWARLSLFLPLIAFLTILFSAANNPDSIKIMQDEPNKNQYKQWGSNDFARKSIAGNSVSDIETYDEANNTKSLVIFINRKSRMLINGKPARLEAVDNMVRGFRDYKSRTDESSKTFVDADGQMSATSSIFVRKDIKTNEGDFERLLTVIGSTIMEIRENKAQQLFNQSYITLDDPQQAKIDLLVPFNVYLLPDLVLEIK